MPFTVPNTGSASYPSQASLDSGDLAILAAAPGLTGVVSGCAVTAQGTPNMTVAVAAGVVRIGGRRAVVAGGNVTIAAANATNPRHDLITVDTTGALAAVTGTPAAISATTEPVFPAIPASRVVLAAVYVPAADTTIDATQITDKRVTVLDPGVENVRWYGATGDAVTDDTNAIQAAINATVAGSTVLFPLGTYLVSASIRLLGGRAYVGAGHGFGGQGATIRQRAGVNMTEAGGLSGVLVADAWYVNATLCGDPMLVQNLYVDGNSANNPTSNACGIVVMNFWSIVDRCQVINTSRHGILLTDRGRNATTVITNSASENRVQGCRIDTTGTGGHGIAQFSYNGDSNQDGYCLDNILSGIAGDGMNFVRGAGWTVRRNHLYGITGSGIIADNCYATVIETNYIEDFGGGAASGAYYAGIRVIQLAGRGTIVSNNSVSGIDTATVVGAYQFLSINAGNGQVDAPVTVLGNQLLGASGANGIGLDIETNGGGGVLHLYLRDNVVKSITTNTFIQTGAAKVYESDNQGREHPTIGSATTAFSGAARGTSPPALTFTGNDRYGSFTFGTGTATTTGSVGGVSFERNYASVPVVNLTPGNAATAALNLYAVPAVGQFGISVVTAPAVSQAATAYVVYYSVRG